MNISVALCTYNGELYLREQLQSILEQTFLVNEIVICDDCSSDTTINIINEFIVNYPSLIKLLINEKNIGAKKSFEKAISHTKGELIFLSDQDDVWFENKVEEYVKYFQSNDKCLLLFSDAILIDNNSNFIDNSLWKKFSFDSELQEKWLNNENIIIDLLRNDNNVTGATVCFHKKLVKNIIPFELPFNYWHDAWITLIAAKFKGVFFINDKFTKYRIHNNQQVGLVSGNLLTPNKKINEISNADFSKILLKKFPKYRKVIFDKYGNNTTDYLNISIRILSNIKSLFKK